MSILSHIITFFANNNIAVDVNMTHHDHDNAFIKGCNYHFAFTTTELYRLVEFLNGGGWLQYKDYDYNNNTIYIARF